MQHDRIGPVRRFALTLAAALALAGCREPDRPIAPGAGYAVAVVSDPAGAAILIDGDDTGTRTPDTVFGIDAGEHRLSVRLDSAGFTYGFAIDVEGVAGDSIIDVFGPLMLRCGLSLNARSCGDDLATLHAPQQLRFAAHPAGPLFHLTGAGDGIRWPAASADSYAAGGLPLFAGVINGSDTVALGIYDHLYLVGRPARVVESSPDFALEQPHWILPPNQLQNIRTVRGIEVVQRIVVLPALPDVIGLRIVFRNVSARSSYRVADIGVPPSGITYEGAWIGFALDADIGDSEDDLFSYDPELDMVVMYDADFRENAFGDAKARPGLLGLRVLDAPAGASVVLNAWPSALDWLAGDINQESGAREADGHRWLAGAYPLGATNHPSAEIGFVGTSANDYRMSVAAGPLRLAPGDSAVITLAVGLASPAPGTFTSGTTVTPGEPTDASRAFARVAGQLLALMRNASALE